MIYISPFQYSSPLPCSVSVAGDQEDSEKQIHYHEEVRQISYFTNRI